MLENTMSRIGMKDGKSIPCIGFGTWKMNNEIVEQAVAHALNLGYRHIDTAAAYENEIGVGRAIKASSLTRNEIFLTSKLPNADHGYEKALVSIEKSLNRLEVDYLDLYLIHWPVIEEHKHRYKEDIVETYLALEEIKKQGKVKSIGVSNFMIEHLEVLKEAKVELPVINQIQFNPQCIESELRTYAKDHHIILEGWSPLLQGKAFENEILVEMAKEYKTSVAQICLRFALQCGVIPIPKSSNPERIKINGDIFSFEITTEDMNVISSLSKLGRIGNEPNIPRKVQVVGFK